MEARGGSTIFHRDPSLLVSRLASTDDLGTPQQIYRDLQEDGRLDGHYSRAEIERAFALPPPAEIERAVALPPPAAPDLRPHPMIDVPPPHRVAIAPPAQSKEPTPMIAVPEFWVALFLVSLLVWWCVDHFVVVRRKR